MKINVTLSTEAHAAIVDALKVAGRAHREELSLLRGMLRHMPLEPRERESTKRAIAKHAAAVKEARNVGLAVAGAEAVLVRS